MEVDYARYGEGEALLGWLNGTVRFEGGDEVDGNDILDAVAAALGSALSERGLEVAHLKMTLNPIGDHFEIGAINLVRDGESAEFSHRLSEPLEDGEMLLNLRAEGDPEVLNEIVNSALESVLAEAFALDYRVVHLEHFRPGQPVPTHRVAAV